MSAMPQRMVPTLTEVLEAPDWRPVTVAAPPVQAEPEPLDEDLLAAITAAVDGALDELRAQLRPRVEAAVRQAMAARQDRDSGSR